MKQPTLRGLNKNDIKIESHELAFQGYFRIEKFKLKHRLFQGGWSDVFERELFERGQGAAILPYDPVRDQVVLIEQFRVGALKDEKSPWLLEIVAGVLKPEEDPEAVAQREAQEEAGIVIEELVPLYDVWVTPGACSERLYMFCGKVDASQANGVHGLDEENEDIRVHVFDAEEAFQLVREGVINTPPAILALQWLELNHGRVF